MISKVLLACTCIFMMYCAVSLQALRPVFKSRERLVSKRHMSDGFFQSLKQGLVSKLAGDYDEEAVKAKLAGYVSQSEKSPSRVTMLTFETCPFCVEARNVLDSKGVKYDDIMIDKMDDGKALRVEMGKQYGQTSVPAIFVNGNFIGGCNNGGMGGLKPLISSGKFEKLLKGAK